MEFINNICLVEEYKEIFDKNKNIFKELENICIKTGEKVEGNCFSEHENIDNKLKELIYKQCNHFSLGKISNNIMEIGFNAGHSSLLYLISSPNSKITVFDLCEHKYTMPCFNYLQTLFPNRLEIYPGDSNKTVPEFHKNNPNKKFDLVHIDGCHWTVIANNDFHNSIKLAGDIIIWDDTHMDNLNYLLNNYIYEGLVYEVNLYKTYTYEHRICRVNHLLNKKYSWNDFEIEFLNNYQMIAFGGGNYKFINKHLVECNFGNKKHLLKFNSDYSKFTSIRKNDFEVINGFIKNKIKKNLLYN